MILRRYGGSIHSVDLNFDAAALTEIGFRRNGALSLSADEFEAGWEKVEEQSFAPTGEGRVQIETDRALLRELEAGVRAMEESLQEDQVLFVESQQGKDYPKVSDTQRTLVEDNRNVLHFSARVQPPLRMGRYRKR